MSGIYSWNQERYGGVIYFFVSFAFLNNEALECVQAPSLQGGRATKSITILGKVSAFFPFFFPLMLMFKMSE